MAGDSTQRLLARARDGEHEALEILFAKYLPRLQQWASGRLPRWARDITDTPDLVQDTLLQTLKRIDGFEPGTRGRCKRTCGKPSSIGSGTKSGAGAGDRK